MIAALTARPGRFEFFQAVRLLERFGCPRGTAGQETFEPIGFDAAPEREVVRFLVQPSLAFARSDVLDTFEEQVGTKPAAQPARVPRMRVSFLGLTGPSGPMPLHYTELLLKRRALKDLALRDLLDVFHHRACSLFYRAWRKYRLPFAFEHARRHRSADRDGDPIAFALRCLIGLGNEAPGRRTLGPSSAALYFAGYFSRRQRTAAGLEAVVSELLGAPAAVEPFVGSWLDVPLDQRTRLGATAGTAVANRLGQGLLLGTRVWDLQSKVRVRAGPLDGKALRGFLPGTPGARRLSDLLRVYVDGAMAVELRCRVTPGTLRGVRLARDPREPDPPGRLGWDAWLGTRSESMADWLLSLDRL